MTPWTSVYSSKQWQRKQFSAAIDCFFSFRPCSVQSMSLFSTFKSFFYFKNKPLGHAQTVSQMSTEAKPLGRVLPPFVVSAPPLPLELLLETVHSIWLYQHGPPPPLEANPPPLIIWALAGGLKKCTAQSYFTPCTTDVTPVKCRRKHMMLIVVFSTFKGTVP